MSYNLCENLKGVPVVRTLCWKDRERSWNRCHAWEPPRKQKWAQWSETRTCYPSSSGPSDKPQSPDS